MARQAKESAKKTKTEAQNSGVKANAPQAKAQPIVQQPVQMQQAIQQPAQVRQPIIQTAKAQPAAQQAQSMQGASTAKKSSPIATIIGTIIVIFGLFLGLGFFLNVIHHTSTTTGYTTTISTANGTFSAAAVTNSSGEVTYTSKGNQTVLKFIDQETGMPLNGLVVGVAINDSDGLGALFTIDPKIGPSLKWWYLKEIRLARSLVWLRIPI